MSGQATGWVLRHGPKDRAERLVLLVIADAANQNGQHAHPGIAAIIRGSLYSRATVYDVLRRLEEAGWVVIEEAGGGRGKATIYGLPGVLETVQPLDPPPGKRVQSEGRNGPIQPDRALSRDVPSNGKEPPSAGRDPGTLILKAWWDELAATGDPTPAQPWPAMLQVVRAMLKAGHPEHRVAWALRNSPTVSTGALTMAINRRLGKGAARSTAATALDMLRGAS